jgi:hypothetical protein
LNFPVDFTTTLIVGQASQKHFLQLHERVRSIRREWNCSSPMPRGVQRWGWTFQEALPKALRLVELTEEFFKQKEAERNAYWNTPEGKAKRETRWGGNQGNVRKMIAGG